MKLGDAVQINIGVSNLAESSAFYEALGMEIVDQNTQPYPWVLLTDGQYRILLNEDGNVYIGLGYFAQNTAERVTQVEALGIELVQKVEKNGRLWTAILADSDDLMAGLITGDAASLYQPPGIPISKCGKFGEFSLGVQDFTTAAKFWTQLGFEQLYASSDPYNWGIFSDGMMVLGFHQTDEFGGPIMTYFAGDMADRIAQLKVDGVMLDEEMPDEEGIVKNGRLKSPDGHYLFLFQGEV